MRKNTTNKMIFKTKIPIESQCSHTSLYGRLWRRMETMPVPMVTENHEGVKFRTILLHPSSFLRVVVESTSSLLSLLFASVFADRRFILT